MIITYSGDRAILTDINSFDIAETLECGQCFRFVRMEEGASSAEAGDTVKYRIVAHNRTLFISEYEDRMEFYPTTEREFTQIWQGYFDLDRDYSQIKDIVTANDFVMRDAVNFGTGTRILNQDPWETLISFIISQNNNIGRIKRIIQTISERYGEPVNDDQFAFPTTEALARLSEAELFECKMGFRAGYVKGAADAVASGVLDLQAVGRMETADARRELMKLKGVGIKVADCVLLFAYGHKEVFPTDVWIKRIMEHFYFSGQETHIKDIHALAAKRFGEYAGFAQQYLFAYARGTKIV